MPAAGSVVIRRFVGAVFGALHDGLEIYLHPPVELTAGLGVVARPGLALAAPLGAQPGIGRAAIFQIPHHRIGTAFGQRRAEKVGIHPRLFSEMVIWMYVVAFFLAHVVSVVFYFPERLKNNPLELLMIWRGISSYGGFLGAVLAVVIFARMRNMPLWPTVDSVCFGLVHGWIFGRAGCSLAHDHPGNCTNFFLGIKYPDVATACPGYTARHDLGFYEFLLPRE